MHGCTEYLDSSVLYNSVSAMEFYSLENMDRVKKKVLKVIELFNQKNKAFFCKSVLKEEVLKMKSGSMGSRILSFFF